MRVRVGRKARQDLVRVIARMATQNMGAASRLRHEFDEAFARLGSFPLSGTVRHDLPNRPRAILVKPYVVLYAVVAGEVTVAHIIDGRRDLKAVLDDE